MKKLIFLVVFFCIVSLFGIGIWVTVRTMAHVAEYIATAAEHVAPREYHYAVAVDTPVIEDSNIHTRVVSSSEGIIYGGIVPYAQSAYPLTRTFFHAVKKQEPPIVVILTANHTEHDSAEVISSRYDWKTSTGILQINTDALYEVQRHVPVTVDEGVVGNEQGLQSVVVAVSELLSQTTVLTFVLSPSVSTSTKVALVDALDRTLPANAVVVASVDGRIYDTDTAAAFHGEVLLSTFARWSDRRADEQLPQVDVLHALVRRRQATGVGCASAMHRSTGSSSGSASSYVSLCFTDGQAVSSSVSFLGFGDMMLDRNVKKQIDRHGAEYLFGSIAGKEKQFYRTVDIVSANLEGPFASYRRPTSKEIAFRFDPALIPMLTDYQFSLFTLANNHSYDMGRDGFEEAKTYLREAGIHFYGSEYAVDDNSLFIEKVGDTRIAFIGLNDTETPLTMSQILPLIERAKKEADSIVVNIHWGIEYKEVSSARQRSLAHALIDEGVDVIIGHHPHVVEEMEIYKDRPIFYSLGNFIFDQYFSVPTQQGLGVGIVFHPRELSVYLFPFQGSESRVQLMSGSARDIFMESFVDRSRLGQYTIHNFHLSIPVLSYSSL